ncbi:MAG: O-antigen ligase family protein [Deltaproteobacteria bacterium]|nr:O-antigen ligase family protein [Deltaproteobacteria bacterium]
MVPLVTWGWEHEWMEIAFSALTAFVFFVLARALDRDRMPARVPGLMLLAGVMGVWITVSILFSKAPVDGLVESVKVLGSFFVYPALFVLAPDERDTEVLTISIAIAVIISCSIGIARVAGLGHAVQVGPYGTMGPASVLGLSGSGAAYVACALPLLISQFIFGQRLRNVVILSMAIVEGIVYVMVSHSRASWVAMILVGLAGICMLVYVGRKKQLKMNLSPLYIAGVVFAGTLLLSLIFSQTHSLIGHLVSLFDVHCFDNIVRLLTCKSVLLGIVPSHPISGVGFGAFGTMFPLYADKTLASLTFSGHIAMNFGYNEYINVLAETGIPGFLIFAGNRVYTIHGFFSSISRAGERQVPVLIGGLLGVVSLAVIGLFSFPFRMPATGFLFWMYAGIGSLSSKSGIAIRPSLWKAMISVLAASSLLVFVTALYIAIARPEYGVLYNSLLWYVF